jgi:nucleotide-binding universal stress UspA family protein
VNIQHQTKFSLVEDYVTDTTPGCDTGHSSHLMPGRRRICCDATRVCADEFNRQRKQNLRILLAIDGSRFSEAALKAVIQQARKSVEQIRVLHVVEPPPLLVTGEMGGYNPALDEAWEAERKHAQRLVERAVGRLRAKGLKANGAAEDGDPKSKILENAKEWRAELIVLGSHGRKGLNRFLMGSVSETVVRHAPCSVEIVRIPRKS